MRRKWIKRAVAILLTPILLFALLMLLLYIPPVQNFLRKEALGYASEATGMQINARRIDLRFPLNLLVRDVEVIDSKDTLLSMESLNVQVQLFPLFRGQVEIDDFTLKNIAFNSAQFIHGMRVRGVLGRFAFRSHGVNLSNETADIEEAELSNTHVSLILKNDTTAVLEDTTAASPLWKIALRKLKLKNVSFSMLMPEDSIHLGSHVAEATITDADIDLKRELYGLKHLHASGTSLNYDLGSAKPMKGFDPSHIAIRELNLGVDSVLYRGRNMNAVIRELSLSERSGLSITSMTGRFFANDKVIQVPALKLTTPHSEINFTGQTTWKLIDVPAEGHLVVKLDAFIGKQDLILFAGGLPDAFKKEYPFRPLTIHAGAEGNLTNLQLSRFKVELPGAFSVTGGGELFNLTDSLKRSGTVDLQAITHNLNFLTTLSGTPTNGSIVFPQDMTFIAKAGMRGSRFSSLLRAKDGEGALSLTANYNNKTEAYDADFTIDALQINHFLPKDSIYSLSASGSVKGKGIDVASSLSSAQFDAQLDNLQYGRFHVSDVTLAGEMKNSLIKAHLTSDNLLLKMVADGEYLLKRTYTEGKLNINVEQIDWYKLGYYPTPMKKPFAFKLAAQARKDSVNISLQAGDLSCRFKGRSTLEQLIKQSTSFSTVLMKQIQERRLDHAALRRVLPSAGLALTAGKDNPFSRFLATKEITYDRLSFLFGTTPARGINGRAFIHGLKVDTIQLDTLFLAIKQDTARMNIRGGVINAPSNPQFVFKAYLTGEIRTEDAELMLEYQNAKGETGVLLGVNARPGRNGLLFKFIPEEPIVAFRKFRFNEDNRVYIRKDRHIFANVEMLDKDGMGVRVHSLRDTTFLQNMDIELRRIRLAEISEALPYLPQFSGLLSAEAHYVQKATSLQVSTEATIDELVYEHQRVGDIALGATWLPGENGRHYVNSYLTHEGAEVMTLNGMYRSGVNDSVEVNSTLEHFPLSIADIFIPDQVVSFYGALDGNLHLTGKLSKPSVDGTLTLDSVSIFARQAGARYNFDSKPVEIKDNRLIFNKFEITTTSKNPFVIDGSVDFRELSRPVANLSLFADNYTLLNAPRNNESLVYGKVFVDVKSTVKGPLNALVMRGNMNLLGNTDVTYVLKDSPLSVQDRLGDLVTFTSFNDTLSQKKEDSSISFGGLDMRMTLHIDPAVRLKADLSPDRSSRIELEGGGDLSLQYSPQGELRVSGRYTLSGGILKYSLPVVPLKDFKVNEGSYVEWTGNPMDPNLNFKATERVRASYTQDGTSSSRMVNFDVSVAVKNKMENLSLVFDLEAPEDISAQNELTAMSSEERSKQAIAMLATGVYLSKTGTKSGGIDMGAALNTVLQNQMSSIAGTALKTVNVSFDMENYDATDAGGKRTNYNFRYAQRFFNDRFQVVLGGTISSKENANETQSFIDNVSLEYRLDSSGTRYVRLFHNKNYDSLLEGEITETGVGVVLRKKMNHLGELFIFKRKK
ncbi:translocation/assembly module TamB domain-containing protein [uncultured Bacteroides sp.]|uniref:translocation/assembly module TamB domain-containing protein n=1 Tax=uncultured Bacteroides sp. TaxID=162156 RepID=UPI002AA80EFA|nr:translocation/assembly module TamB domain-containing protein [uncultured Bacteroides sp.]